MSTAGPGPVYVVGAGRVGSALAALLARAGVDVAGLWSRGPDGAAAASQLTGLECAHGAFGPEIGGARTVILAVRDEVIPVVAGALLDGGLLRSARVVLHCSGATPAAVALGPLRRASCARGTLHPLVAIAAAGQASRQLPGAHFAVEGDAEARVEASALVAAIGARSFELASEQMALYHAAAVLASNFPVALWAAALHLLGSAGVASETAHDALVTLVQSTAENFGQLGAPRALTGPVRRGDLETVERHLAELARRAPELTELYRVCSREVAHVAAQAEPRLGEQLSAIEKKLSGG